MPRPKKNTSAPEPTPEEQALQEQAPPSGPEQEAPGAGQTAAGEIPTQEDPASQKQQAPAGPELNEEPQTLAAYLMDSVKEFMRDHGINGHQPESVLSAIQGVAVQAAQYQDTQTLQLNPNRDPDWPRNVAEYFEYFQLDIHPQEMVEDFITMLGVQAPEPQAIQGQEQTESPMEPEIPLSVRINSLEMDGDTRAFATAEYGDLTIRRIRVKEDNYGTLSVNMPKYRKPSGWEETCRFNTPEARNRLTGAVLDAYQQQMTQEKGQQQAEGPGGAQTPGEGSAPDAAPDLNEQEQGGLSMSMSQ